MEPREYKAYAFRELKTEGDGLFSGYASAYTKDLLGDRIEPGAFAQSIADKKGKVPILYNHDDGRLPLGVSTSLAEDGKGLALSGKLFPTADGNDAYTMLQTAADVGYRVGLSIGFIANDWDWGDDGRLIKEIDLWEISITPFPAQPKAYVADVKTLRDLEARLRDVGGFSKTEAKRILCSVAACNQSSGGMLGGANLLNRVQQALSTPLYQE